jgi:hypothetical protein
MKKMFPWFMAVLFAAGAGMGAFDIARAENGLLVIENGTGSGEYSVGDLVPIEADQPQEGYTFRSWEGDVGGITDIYEPSTTVTVGSSRSDIYPVYMVEESRCRPSTGILKKYQAFSINPDDHTGKEGSTRPKYDKHDGKKGDNRLYMRHNVARAFKSGPLAYWYTSSHRKSGEPNPKGEQWVDYKPNFSKLGVGRYRILATYRSTRNRASYPALYIAKNTKTGDFTKSQKQNQSRAYRVVDMGVRYMCKDSYLRVEDPGSRSIAFGKAKFIYLGP